VQLNSIPEDTYRDAQNRAGTYELFPEMIVMLNLVEDPILFRSFYSKNILYPLIILEFLCYKFYIINIKMEYEEQKLINKCIVLM
jgi:hypothetical protein